MTSTAMARVVRRPEAVDSVSRHGMYPKLGNAIVALALVGYPLIASISQFTGYGSSELNIAYRMFVVLLCTIMIAWSIMRGNYRIDGLVAVFFACYSIRLLADWSYGIFPDLEDHITFFVAAVFIPTLAMGGARSWFDEQLLAKMALVIGLVASALIAYLLLTGAIGASADIGQEGRAQLDFLNPISIGYHGLFTAAAAVVVLVRFRTSAWFVPCVAAIILGAYLLIASGSRGPFVALLVGLVITGSANRHANATYVGAAMIVAGAVAYFGLPEGVLNRFRDISSDLSALERLYAIQLSLDAMIDHPLVGYAYIEPVTGIYPHNLLLEAGLAMGLVGLVIMGWMQGSLLWNAWRQANNKQWMLPFLSSVIFTNAWISGSLWGSTLFFVLVWLNREARHRPAQIQVRYAGPTGTN